MATVCPFSLFCKYWVRVRVQQCMTRHECLFVCVHACSLSMPMHSLQFEHVEQWVRTASPQQSVVLPAAAKKAAVKRIGVATTVQASDDEAAARRTGTVAVTGATMAAAAVVSP
jgi:hypothetical protein